MHRIREAVEYFLEDLENREISYSGVADEIMKNHPELKLSHRTIRSKVAEIYKSIVNTGILLNKVYSPMPSPTKRLQPFLGGDPNNVIIIGDTQFPFEREGYLEHCRETQEIFKCGTVIHIGDVADNHYSSFHPTDPDGYGAGEELDRVIDRTKEWHRIFPNTKVCIGNHDAIIQRKAYASGLSSRWLKGLDEVLETPTWEYDTEFIINGTLYTHTLGSNALQAALLRQMNLVVGHEHSKAEIRYAASLTARVWSMNVGAGVDDKKYAFNYGRTAPKKSIISCGVVVGTTPFIIPMEL